MINSFSDKATEDLFNRKFVRHLPTTIQKLAYKKLLLIDAAESLNNLRIPLEKNRTHTSRRNIAR